MKNNFYLAEKFSEMLEKAAGENFFDIGEDASLRTTVHTGKTIEAFQLSIEFPDDSVLVTTRAFLRVKQNNYFRVKALLESINKVIMRGNFFIDAENIVSFSVKCDFGFCWYWKTPLRLFFVDAKRLKSIRMQYLSLCPDPIWL